MFAQIDSGHHLGDKCLVLQQIIFLENLEKSPNYFNRELILHAFNLHFGLS